MVMLSSVERKTLPLLPDDDIICRRKGLNTRRRLHHLLVLHLEDLVHGDHTGAVEVLAVLAHLDGLQPLGHRPEGGPVGAAGAGQADGYAARAQRG